MQYHTIKLNHRIDLILICILNYFINVTIILYSFKNPNSPASPASASVTLVPAKICRKPISIFTFITSQVLYLHCLFSKPFHLLHSFLHYYISNLSGWLQNLLRPGCYVCNLFSVLLLCYSITQ